MLRYEKVYVSMLVRVTAEGNVRPVLIEWEDGRRYEVGMVTDVRMAVPAHVGGALSRRYRVTVGGREKFLFMEPSSGRWFVERPCV